MLARHFLRPFNWGMLQTSLDHLASQVTGIVSNGWVCHEFIFAGSFCFDLLSDVEMLGGLITAMTECTEMGACVSVQGLKLSTTPSWPA